MFLIMHAALVSGAGQGKTPTQLTGGMTAGVGWT